jgi:hypothetical protein
MPEPLTMPPVPMPLSQRIAISKAIEVIRERGALRDDTCPECKHHDWNIDVLGILATTLTVAPESSLPPPPGLPVHFVVPHNTPPGVIPVVNVTCTTCGYTKFFNLNKLGLVR